MFWLEIRKYLVVRLWNSLTREVVEDPSLESLITGLDKALESVLSGTSCASWGERRNGKDDLTGFLFCDVYDSFESG